ncbi:MAG: hypothetical protein KIPDCIKN_02101 [Haliscomenobacter sp.]|nr:hypothetical protein [Haliscomenobacter sp.]
MKPFFLLLAFTTTIAQGLSQEINCTVKINVQKLQNADPRLFESLELAITDFLNNTKWTEDVFETNERINCNLLLTLQEEFSSTSFKMDLAVQASRPVYGSNYETPILNHVDRELVFSYEQNQPLQFSRNSFNDNLSSVLSFYMYIILGLDYDSFSLYGGEPHFLTAQDILNTVPQGAGGTYPGWRSVDGNRNRFWIAENLLSPRVRLFREAMYAYHRQSLDIMHQDVAKGRAILSETLENVLKVHQTYPNSMIVQMFVNTKGQEVMEIFKLGTPQEKEQAIRVMTRIDPTNMAKYRTLN